MSAWFSQNCNVSSDPSRALVQVKQISGQTCYTRKVLDIGNMFIATDGSAA
jgi:hypothetical protein